MQATNFNNYLTAFQMMLSKFHEEIDNIHDSDIREEMYELQNINRFHINLNSAIQCDAEVHNRKEKEEDFEDCIDKLKSIATSGKQEKRLTEQEELKKKQNILDKAAFLKHFTSSVVTEVDDELIGVMLTKDGGKAETIRFTGRKTKTDLLKKIHDLNGTSTE